MNDQQILDIDLVELPKSHKIWWSTPETIDRFYAATISDVAQALDAQEQNKAQIIIDKLCKGRGDVLFEAQTDFVRSEPDRELGCPQASSNAVSS